MLSQRRLPQRRRQFLAGRWVLRLLAAQAGGALPQDCEVGIDTLGRPFACGTPGSAVEGQRWHASISHSGDLITVAIDREPLGLDVECWPPPRERDVAGLMALIGDPEEQWAWAHGTEPLCARSFLRTWTLKEARLKACGEAATADALRRCSTRPVAPALTTPEASRLHRTTSLRAPVPASASAWSWLGSSFVWACWRASPWTWTAPAHWPSLSVPISFSAEDTSITPWLMAFQEA